MASEIGIFLGEVLRKPTEVVAIAPSSGAVARRMTEGLEGMTGPVVEIGPGTGSFTKAILERGIAPEQLTLLETNARFCETLSKRFPGVRVLNSPAQEIAEIGLTGIAAVISGVPVLARPRLQREVVGRAFAVMTENGFFTQVTYSPNAPIGPAMQRELGVTATRRGVVWANLPPARVFEFRRRRH